MACFLLRTFRITQKYCTLDFVVVTMALISYITSRGITCVLAKNNVYETMAQGSKVHTDYTYGPYREHERRTTKLFLQPAVLIHSQVSSWKDPLFGRTPNDANTNIHLSDATHQHEPLIRTELAPPNVGTKGIKS